MKKEHGHYEAVLLHEDEARVYHDYGREPRGYRLTCGHKHRTPENAFQCGRTRWGKTGCLVVGRVTDDTWEIVR